MILKPRKQKISTVVPPLAMRDGVAPSRVWLPKGEWSTVGEFLLQRFKWLDPEALSKRVQQGGVVNSVGKPQAMDTPYQAEQWLWYYREVENEVVVPFELPILHADEQIIVVDKPHFLASVPTGNYLRETALTRLRAHFNNADITPLHRLDRETAGVLLFGVQPQNRGAYQQLFQTQEVEKTYEAVAPSVSNVGLPFTKRSRIDVADGDFVVRESEGEPNSETVISALSTWFDEEAQQTLTHYQLQPLTGRKHQLRVHLNSLGCPIVNDGFYPVWNKDRVTDDYQHPLQLLARRIAFVDPINGQYREYSSQRTLARVVPRGGK